MKKFETVWYAVCSAVILACLLVASCVNDSGRRVNLHLNKTPAQARYCYNPETDLYAQCKDVPGFESAVAVSRFAHRS